MKYSVLLFFAVFMALSCEKEQAKTTEKAVQEITAGDNIRDIIRNPVSEGAVEDTVNVAKIVFKEIRYDFGTVNEGDIVKNVFKFTNEGKVPLVIVKAKSTCGCTIPEWPEEPIPPGGSGEINVRFDTKNKPGRQGKPITIMANTYPKDTYLQLSGFVTPKE